MSVELLLKLGQLLIPIGIAVGYMRGRLNGLVDKVTENSAAISALEEKYANCEARMYYGGGARLSLPRSQPEGGGLGEGGPGAAGNP